MREHAHAGMSLYGSTGSRKYLNAAERRRFIRAARRAPLDVQLFCLVLSLTGGRISEILALTPAGIDSGVTNITNPEAPQARDRPPGAPAPQPDRRTQSCLSSTATPARSKFRLWQDLGLEPDDRVAARQGGYGRCQDQRYTRDAEGTASRLWRQRLPVQRSAASGATLAWARLVTHHSNIWRRNRYGGTRVRSADVG